MKYAFCFIVFVFSSCSSFQQLHQYAIEYKQKPEVIDTQETVELKSNRNLASDFSLASKICGIAFLSISVYDIYQKKDSYDFYHYKNLPTSYYIGFAVDGTLIISAICLFKISSK